MIQSVQVKAPARLHLGFLDLNGEIGRKFGSIGLAVSSHHTYVTAQFCSADDQHDVPQDLAEKVTQTVSHFQQHFSALLSDPQPVSISISQVIPSHAGLGSGTQLAITIGTALSQLYKLDLSTAEIAGALNRGARSGIGIATFDHGGFIVDGGLSKTAKTPPLLTRIAFPESWRVVLIVDHNQQGVHGDVETSAFKTLPPFPLELSQTICHLTLMQLLPALIERDIASFGRSITEIQALIGDHFSPVQGGRYASSVIGSLLNEAHQLGHEGIAQSSWGPTGCIFVESQDNAQLLAGQLRQSIGQYTKTPEQYSIIVAEAQNTGAMIEIND